jgi:hypothetical protein
MVEVAGGILLALLVLTRELEVTQGWRFME